MAAWENSSFGGDLVRFKIIPDFDTSICDTLDSVLFFVFDAKKFFQSLGLIKNGLVMHMTIKCYVSC